MLKTNIILGDRYQLKQRLNHKQGRETWLTSNLFTNNKIVIKFLAFSPQMQWEELKLFEREAEVLKHLNHPQIPKYQDYFSLDKEAGNGLCWFALVQDYIPGKSLEKLLKEGARFSESKIEDIAKQILEILIYLHQQEPPVIHRDIKPSNIILDGERAYLVDFGAAQNKAAATGLTFTVVGTAGYAPLEQFWGKAIPASDLYALGATIIHLLTGIYPGDLMEENLQIQFASLVSLKPHLIGWLKAMTAPDAQQRYQTAEKALYDLRSGSFISCSQETIYSPYSQKILVERSREDLIVQFLGNGRFTTSNILQTLGNLINFFDALVTYSWSIIVAFLPTAIALLPLWYAWFLLAISSDAGDLIIVAFIAFLGGVFIFGIPYLIILGIMIAKSKKISEFNKKHMEINFDKLQKSIWPLLPQTRHLSFNRSFFISQIKSWGIELKLCQGNTNFIEDIQAQKEAIALTYRQKQKLKKYRFGSDLKMREKEWLVTIIKDWLNADKKQD
jgi:serine/threonine protein kinase